MKSTHGQNCKCGHGREMHEHYRAGSDCGECSATVCAKFRRDRFSRNRLVTLLSPHDEVSAYGPTPKASRAA